MLQLRRFVSHYRALVATAAIFAAVLFVFLLLPIDFFEKNYSFVLEDCEGLLLGATTSTNGYWHFPPAQEVPHKFEKAVITFEDKRFYSHPGIDILALARAIRQNILQKKIVSGASTITMQTVRIGLKNKKRTYAWKIAESLIALKLDLLKDKKDILLLFASHAPFGGNVVGIEAASWRYFGRPPEELSWAESATLAVLPNAPSLITLAKNRDRLVAKRNFLLHKLHDVGYIDSESLSLALLEVLPDAPYPIPQTAFHALQTLKKQHPQTFLVRSSLKKDLQEQGNLIIQHQLKRLSANDIRNAAVIVVENWSGAVRTYIGNTPDPASVPGGYVDILQSQRSTGSLLKPFLYASSLDEGLFTPNQLIEDAPIQFSGFRPENSSKRFSGAVPAYLALARSLNIPAINMLKNYGVDRFYNLLKRVGMSTLHRNADGYGLPLIIGGAEGSLWELSSMYALLARAAARDSALVFQNRLHLVEDTQRESTPSPFSRGAAFLTLEALLRVQRPGIEEHWQEYESSKRIAWKTGTSQGYRDAWAIGVTHEYTVGVWVGNADGTARPELGGYYVAAPLMFAIFNMLKDSPWFNRPESALRAASVCAKSGHISGPYCESSVTTYVPVNAPFSKPCSYCVNVLLNAEGTYRTTPILAGEKTTILETRFVLPARMEQFYRMNNTDYRILPPLDPRLTNPEEYSPLAIMYPDEGASIYIPFDLDGKRGELILQAFHRLQGIEVYWHLDSEYLGKTTDLHQMSVQPRTGMHTLTLVDTNGETTKRMFRIVEK